ncbi:hypothetical protein HRbin12_00175 [bacterium HR12]|nr:hypothetical protein HRbin12_00175 [bacterium HR12]
MTHPEELLAPYVDGVLDAAERAAVEAHLAACPRCREEVALARRAVQALADLTEEPVPLGVTGPVLAEARRAGEPRRSRWVPALAVAAALALAGAIVLPQLLRGRPGPKEGASATTAMEADRGAAELAAPAAPPLETWDADLDERAAKRLTARWAPPPSPTYAGDDEREEALGCLLESGAVVDDAHELVRLIAARYLGTPAYVGVFREGPGGGEPPSKVVVWIVASDDCRILSLLSRTL